MKKITLLLCLFLFACSSDNPFSSNAETVDGKITFEFENVPPYEILYPSADLSTGITESIQPDPGAPSGLLKKTIRTFDYQFPPFSQILTKLSGDFKGYLIIKVFIETDSSKFAFMSKDFTSNRDSMTELIDIPF